MLAKPPQEWKPHELFRVLSRIDGPRVRLTQWPLEVHALSGDDVVHGFSGATELPDAEQRGERVAFLIAASVRQLDNTPLYASPTEVLELSDRRVSALWSVVRDALEACSPTYQHSDSDAWAATLREGAKHVSNVGAARRMRMTHDLVIGARKPFRHPRPDLYYGRPVGALTDGQLMVFEAARHELDNQ